MYEAFCSNDEKIHGPKDLHKYFKDNKSMWGLELLRLQEAQTLRYVTTIAYIFLHT
jgi:hypothetical protein